MRFVRNSASGFILNTSVPVPPFIAKLLEVTVPLKFKVAPESSTPTFKVILFPEEVRVSLKVISPATTV